MCSGPLFLGSTLNLAPFNLNSLSRPENNPYLSLEC